MQCYYYAAHIYIPLLVIDMLRYISQQRQCLSGHGLVNLFPFVWFYNSYMERVKVYLHYVVLVEEEVCKELNTICVPCLMFGLEESWWSLA